MLIAVNVVEKVSKALSSVHHVGLELNHGAIKVLLGLIFTRLETYYKRILLETQLYKKFYLLTIVDGVHSHVVRLSAPLSELSEFKLVHVNGVGFSNA